MKRRRRLLAIINPISGSGRIKPLVSALGQLARRAEVDIEPRLTERVGHAGVLAARAAAEAFDAVIACGGDGTINEVVNGLGPGGLPLMVVARGTGNALAREIGASSRPLRHADALREWRTFRRDLGRLPSEGGRLFASFVGAGFDAECVRVFKERRPGSIHPLRYLPLMGSIMLGAIERSNFTSLRVDLDGGGLLGPASYAFIAVSPVFGGPIRLIPEAIPDDGLFDLMALLGPVDLGAVLRMVTYGALHRTRRWKELRFARAARVGIAAAEPGGRQVPYQVDGDFAGYLPIAAEIVAGGLTLFETH